MGTAWAPITSRFAEGRVSVCFVRMLCLQWLPSLHHSHRPELSGVKGPPNTSGASQEQTAHAKTKKRVASSNETLNEEVRLRRDAMQRQGHARGGRLCRAGVRLSGRGAVSGQSSIACILACRSCSTRKLWGERLRHDALTGKAPRVTMPARTIPIVCVCVCVCVSPFGGEHALSCLTIQLTRILTLGYRVVPVCLAIVCVCGWVGGWVGGWGAGRNDGSAQSLCSNGLICLVVPMS